MTIQMNPVTPEITIRTLTDDDTGKLVSLMNRALKSAPYSGTYDSQTLRDHLLGEVPLTVGPMSWQAVIHIGAWRAGELIGFLDAATGYPPDEPLNVNATENLTLPGSVDEKPLCGLLRMLILPERPELTDLVFQRLLQRANDFWHDAGITTVYAFKHSIGYPYFQGGAGVLPGNWSEHFRLLTAHGYQLEQRHRALVRPILDFVEEVYPTVNISLASGSLANGWESVLYHRRIQRVAYMRIFGATLRTESALQQETGSIHATPAEEQMPVPIAVIAELHVNTEWRGQDLGKLLVRRAINDAHHRGYQELLVYLSQSQHVAWSLVTQQGFQELSYNGYSFIKVL